MLKALGRRVTRKLLGNLRSPDGLLLTRRYFVEADQEWRLGHAILGLGGFPVVIAIFIYVQIAYGHLRVPHHGIRLGHWSDLSLDMKILTPLTFLCFVLAMASCLRCMLIWGEISHQPRSDVDD